MSKKMTLTSELGASSSATDPKLVVEARFGRLRILSRRKWSIVSNTKDANSIGTQQLTFFRPRYFRLLCGSLGPDRIHPVAIWNN